MVPVDITITQDGVICGTAKDLSYDFVREKKPIYADGSTKPTGYEYGSTGTVGRITFDTLDQVFFSRDKPFTLTLITGSSVITLQDNLIVAWDDFPTCEFVSSSRPVSKLWTPQRNWWSRFKSWFAFSPKEKSII